MNGTTENTRTVMILGCIILIAAAIATAAGIFSHGGEGGFTYTSIRGEEISIYGKGIYRHMSEEVAVQGIGQDYITLCVVLPLLSVFLYRSRKEAMTDRIILTGILGYIFVQYLFYMIMGMYSALFLIYVLLTGTSFFAFILSLLSVTPSAFLKQTGERFPRRYVGIFLLVNTALIALLWLSIVVPPLLDGTLYPAEVEHYTTLIVQGMDLALLLPLAAVSAVLALRNVPAGYVYSSVYTIFLTLQMLALCAKIAAMGMTGYSIIPVIFIIPTIFLFALTGTVKVFQSLKG